MASLVNQTDFVLFIYWLRQNILINIHICSLQPEIICILQQQLK